LTARLPLLFLVSVLPGLFGCGAARTRTIADELRNDSKEQQFLHDSVRLHWDGRRWGDGARASEFLEDGGDRLLFQDWLETERERIRLVDITILKVEISDADMEAADGHIRTGTAHLRVEGYTLPAQIVEKKRVEQEWYRSTSGWWVIWEEPAAE